MVCNTMILLHGTRHCLWKTCTIASSGKLYSHENGYKITEILWLSESGYVSPKIHVTRHALEGPGFEPG